MSNLWYDDAQYASLYLWTFSPFLYFLTSVYNTLCSL